MEEPTRDGTPAANDHFDEDWELFEQQLAVHLATMVDPEEGDHLLLELPGNGERNGCTPYAQFASFGEGRFLRAEIAGDGYLARSWQMPASGADFLRECGWAGNDLEEKNWFLHVEIDSADVAANHVVWVLRCHYGISHPSLLSYHCWGPAAAGIELHGLSATDAVPDDLPAAPVTVKRGHEPILHRLAIKPVDRDDVLHMVESLLREKYDVEPQVDDDGDFVLAHRIQTVWVRVREDQPVVEVMTRVVHDLPSRRRAAVELGLLNRRNIWCRWTIRQRDVWQTMAFPVLPFVPAHAAMLLDAFYDALESTHEDLVVRTGGKEG